jgi:type IV pilus assembly protein PilW
MIALAVTAIILVGVVAAVNSQQRSFYGGQRMREAQSSARAALLELQRTVRRAGYGMDPSYAFNFGLTPAVLGGGRCPPVEMAPCPPDSVNNSDELVFYARNPNYWVPDDRSLEPRGNAWRLLALDAAKVRLEAHAGDFFPRGQIFMAVCMDASYFTYFTSDQTIWPPVAANGFAQQINLTAVNAANPFMRQDEGDGGINTNREAVACYNSGFARVFRIDMFRYHIRPVIRYVAAGRNFYDPYLMLDQGVDSTGAGGLGLPDTVIDATDEIAIADNIEDFQVGYEFFNAGQYVGNMAAGVPAAGLAAGTPIVFAAGVTPPVTPGSAAADQITLTGPMTPTMGRSAYEATSYFNYKMGSTPDDRRKNNNQANVRRVRIAMIGRSSDPDFTSNPTIQLNTLGAVGGNLLNQNAAPAWITANYLGYPYDGFQRARVDATIDILNMDSIGMTNF